MTTGFFLYHLDKTTCGGRILSGAADNTYETGGLVRQQVREGDPVTCGKHEGRFRVCGGMGDTYSVNGATKEWAGSLDSYSSCPCRARFIPSVQTHTYESDCNAGRVAERAETAKRKARQSGPEQRAQAAKKKREITLTIGVFFDGTGNNTANTAARQGACTGEHFGMNDAESTSALEQCIQQNHGVSGIAAGSYLGYYSNVHWLNTLYSTDFPSHAEQGQQTIYIEGIGTETNAGDSTYGMGTGQGDTGVLRKTDKAVAALTSAIKDYLAKPSETNVMAVRELQFDIFGFSRGAAAARHFANRIFSQDSAIVAAINAGLDGIAFSGTPGGKTRFLGIFDTVAAIGTPVNGLNPHSADSGDVNLALRPGIAEKVFHITAQHECRFNFALNSVKPAWPELALPGAHSDIGGGYNPDEHEACFLTRPVFETVSLSTPDTKTRVYQQTCEQLEVMEDYPAIAPLLNAVEVNIDTWHDERMPADHYGTLQKRSAAALVIDRPTRNDWSKVALRVMLDAAQDAGVIFDPILPKDNNLSLPPELNSLCEKAIVMGRAARSGRPAIGFTTPEILMLAEKYIHCSANWNSVLRDEQKRISGAVRPAKLVMFTNRPDDRWQRTVYDMDGNKIWK
ncbi:phospholipase effector Tle1 domain-containing protein [Pantoea sp. GABEPS69]|uniref:phospholipase effector Tle1 domain-containing protein n=1 Tax=Pantoea sp. GABEPS69 TaxID=3028805 RepID=UPI003891A358